MPRYAKKSSVEDLRNKFNNIRDDIIKKYRDEDEGISIFTFIDETSEGEQMFKDLQKIEFDLENASIGCIDELVHDDINPEYTLEELKGIFKKAYTEDPNCAISSLPSVFLQLKDYAILLCWGGGDWEYPLFFILYLDNKNHLRGYVPSKGNTFNLKYKSAYGNNEDYPEDDEIVDLRFKPDFEMMIEDIQNRIVIKEN